MPVWKPSCLRQGADESETGSSRKKSSSHAPNAEATESAPSRRASINEDQKGKVVVDLIKREGCGLGLTISGGVDKNSKPWISSLRTGGIAQRSDSLLVGDFILSVNGIRTTNLQHGEVVNLLKNAGERVTLEVEFELPPLPFENGLNVVSKTVEITLSKENNSFGFVIRGGICDENSKTRPLTMCHIRPGGPADRDGTLKVCDRLISVDGICLTGSPYQEAIAVLKQSGHNAVMLIEYDVSVMDAVTTATGPLLVEVAKTPGTNLGITLSSLRNNTHNAIVIDSVRPASIADRCGALHVGDEIRSIDDIDTRQMSVAEASQFLLNSSDQIKLEILPISQLLPKIRSTAEKSLVLASVSPAAFREPSVYTTGTMRSTMSRKKPTRLTSKLGRQNSSASVSSSYNTMPANQVCRTETTEVILQSPSADYGISLQGGVFSTEILSSPPIIDFLEPGGPAERCGVIQVGDRVLSVNGKCTEDRTLEESVQVFRDSGTQCSMEIEFDVAESVVPSSGTFIVKLPKMEGGLGITISCPKQRKAGEPLLISHVKKGSVAHRTGTLSPGDKLLAIDSIPLDNCTVEDAAQILQQADEIVKLRIQKDDTFSDEPGSGAITYSVELIRHGGSLGITISGTEEPFDPIVISGLTDNGLAERTGAIHVGDVILAINSVPLRGQPLSEAIRLLQTVGDTVNLKICKPRNQKRAVTGAAEASNAAMMSDYDNLESNLHFHKDRLRRDRHSTPITSADSAVDSWDGSGFDAGYHSNPTVAAAGKYPMQNQISEASLKQRTGRLTRPQRPKKCKSRTKVMHNEHGSDDEEEWDLQTNSCNSGNGCGSSDALSSDQDEKDANDLMKNYIWTEALKDLEKCGQTDILRELMEDTTLDRDTQPPATVNGHAQVVPKSSTIPIGRGHPTDFKNINDQMKDIFSPTPIELHKVALCKDMDYDDFGFSVSDGLYERGVYVNCVRPGGPAAQTGNIRPFDRILQINHTRTRDFDCCMVVPLIAEAGERLEVVISRNPLAQPEIQHQQHLGYGWQDDLIVHSAPKTSSKTL
ncbi:glutamate receptor-interacting protein 1-like [Saccoglossus kowalevskii]|uniref:Glutamate receptor-interacting protein 1-like n=1 Tax=Saccoglossus kowalevskii TaxID=10224 RepID=A0ABM0M499_SACKO|nr:PREDICTED: glutamate receptor-interacting protein 1-like [Saccoglossus kowalevskii]